MSDTETNPIGTMERLRRCEEALRAVKENAVFTPETSRATVDEWVIERVRAALTPMTKPEQEGV